MALLGSLAAVRGQMADARRFGRPWLASRNASARAAPLHSRLEGLADGQTERVDLAGGAFALLQAYRTKPRTEGRWETHRATSTSRPSRRAAS